MILENHNDFYVNIYTKLFVLSCVKKTRSIDM